MSGPAMNRVVADFVFDVIHEKTLYGRKFMGVVRSTFLIDAHGKLRAEWRKVSVKGARARSFRRCQRHLAVMIGNGR